MNMSRNADRKIAHFGPGGINCNCCRPAKCNKTDAKKFSARRIRRNGKISTQEKD